MRICSGSKLNCFNPLPSPKQGETHYVPVTDASRRRFQSAPLTEARGDTLGESKMIAHLNVSIRSPHRSKGRRAGSGRSPHAFKGFNPLPSPKQGETNSFCKHIALLYVSIRSPHRSKGRLAGWGFDYPSRLSFNPLPSPKQGETSLPGIFSSGGLVSIRSPHRSKGRLLLAACGGCADKFQSAPLTEARGDLPPSEHLLLPACFNPLPSPKQGETKLREPTRREP